MKSLGLYIHVPFCERKCNYCGFLSFSGCEEDVKSKYMAALRNELRYRLGLLGLGDGSNRDGYDDGNNRSGGVDDGDGSNRTGAMDAGSYSVDTVFVGGGTPSCIENAEDLASILGILNELPADGVHEEDLEVTIEANPGTLTYEKLLAYRKMGINRLSMGVQSFDDELLKKLGRIHTAEMVYNNFSLARECGFDNINLDLMFGLPGQSMERWENTLNEAINLGAEHISFYSLQLEENTPFFKDFEAGQLELPSDELDREMYHRAIAILKEAGYYHYEISNASHKGYYCKHNYKYWSMEEYLGVGLGASSFLGGARFRNTDDLAEYIEIWANIDIFSALAYDVNLMKKGTVEWHDNKFHDFVSEFVFTGLRKTEGIDLNEFEERYGVGFFEYFESQKAYVDFCIQQGYMDTSSGSGTDMPPSPRGEGFPMGERLRLTEKGIDISNSIMAEFV